VAETEQNVVSVRTKEAGPAGTTRRDPQARPTRRPRAWSRRRPDWMLIPGPALTLAVLLWGITATPYWGDEADTVSAISRSLPQLVRLLRHTDAVHALYYLVLWPVTRVAGTGELATRLPSVVAMVAAAAGITVIGRRLVSRQAGLCAGLLFAVLPTVTQDGQQARPYAMVMAVVVLASYLLLRAAQDPRPRWFVAYGLSIVLIGYLELFALLLVPAHAVTLIGLGRRPGGRVAVLRRWLLTAVAAGAVLAPVTVLSWTQRAQISWIPKPGWNDAGGLVVTLLAEWAAAAVLIALLGVLGGTRLARLAVLRSVLRRVRDDRDHGGVDGRLAWLAWPWLLLPPLLLLAVSFIQPVFDTRYVTFCVPAVALLAGAGLAALRRWARVGALALVVAFVVPTQLGLRVPVAVGDTQIVGQFLSAHERPGDAIVFPQGSIPPWNLVYPQGFAQLRDLSLKQTPAQAGHLFGTTVPVSVVLRRERGISRIWIIPMSNSKNPARYLAPGFRLVHRWELPGHQTVLLYTRTGASHAPQGSGG
jgi:mannosyltransferase